MPIENLLKDLVPHLHRLTQKEGGKAEAIKLDLCIVMEHYDKRFFFEGSGQQSITQRFTL